ncbi:diguanylate cyclase [Cellvibrio sp. UBA7661]|uniref:sensor domain-containing diguanylate cyclase n=1 Tax=Cellvibrio sp. UBA7661 TaxID=1946311 RepID=UPI002F356BA5
MTDHLDILLDMLSALPDPVFVLTESGRYAALIGGQDRQHYHDGAYLVDFSLYDVLPKAKADWFLEQIKTTLAQNQLRIVEYGLAGTDVDGLDTQQGPEGEIWFEGRIQPLSAPINNERAVVWVACNITRRHQLEAKLQLLSETDELTGAYNRRKLLDALTLSLKHFRERQTPTAVVLMDIDYFKSINDRFGHVAGDEVLRGIAHHAMAHLREGDLFARFGGEEFALLLPNTSLVAAELIAERLRLSIAAGDFLSGANLTVTVSMGLSLIQPQDQSIESILHRADDALYKAKHNGRNCFISAS